MFKRLLLVLCIAGTAPLKAIVGLEAAWYTLAKQGTVPALAKAAIPLSFAQRTVKFFASPMLAANAAPKITKNTNSITLKLLAAAGQKCGLAWTQFLKATDTAVNAYMHTTTPRFLNRVTKNQDIYNAGFIHASVLAVATAATLYAGVKLVKYIKNKCATANQRSSSETYY